MSECPNCGSQDYWKFYSGWIDGEPIEPDTGHCEWCGFQYSQHVDYPESYQVARYRLQNTDPKEIVTAAFDHPEMLLEKLKERLGQKHNSKSEIVIINYYIQPHGHCNAPIKPSDLSPPENNSGEKKCGECYHWIEKGGIFSVDEGIVPDNYCTVLNKTTYKDEVCLDPDHFTIGTSTPKSEEKDRE
jgi:hypothetical protein